MKIKQNVKGITQVAQLSQRDRATP